ncbi:MAG: biopolymer transporter ExbD [Lysobacterales bacterium]
MAFTKNKQAAPMSDMNVTPMVDVMLVLLIIFMITAPKLNHKVDIDLPQKTRNPITVVDPPPPIELRILATGEMFWNGQPLIREALEPQLRLEASKDPQSLLQVDADKMTPYQAVADVLATAKRVQMDKIGFKNLSG